MKPPFFLSLLLLVASCTEAPVSRPLVANPKPAPVSSRFRRVKGNFFRDQAGRLFEQREWVRESAQGTWYDSTVAVPQASGPVAVPLSDVLDLATYQELGNSQFSKDRRHIYYSYTNSGGGFRVVVSGADLATFHASPDYQYGFDARHGYYCDRQLPGLNVRRRQLLYGDTVAHFVAYVKDDQHVFYQSEPVPGADALTFHLVQNRAWEAEDKNHRYQCCGQHFRQ